MKRIIGRYSGQEKGPLLICFGGVHGNEPAGVQALELMFKMLEVEPITNPAFSYKGALLGLIGNTEAYKSGQRFIDTDLNRIWTKEKVDFVSQAKEYVLNNEEKELKALIHTIQDEIENYQPHEIYILDLHTTSSYGGIFTIACDDQRSMEIAMELHAPVITGMLEGIYGTTLHYFNEDNFSVPTTGVLFESGQHTEPLSVNRAIAAITNCMRTIGSIDARHIENRHDRILIEYSRKLPKVATLVLRHEISNGDQFEMMPNYHNFQKVSKGEIIATNKYGAVSVPEDSLLLMPLYQKQGEDGFFLVKKLEGY